VPTSKVTEGSVHAPPRTAWMSTAKRAGARYEQLRQVLIRFFEWRGAPYPEEHADATFDRVREGSRRALRSPMSARTATKSRG